MKPPAEEDLDKITHTIAKRVSRYLERAGYLYRDAETEYLDLVPEEEDAMHEIIGASISYRLAFGSNAGRKALTLQAVPISDTRQRSSELVSKQSGFSLHAGVACKSNAFAGMWRGLRSRRNDCRWPVTVTWLSLLRQRVYALAIGDEDLNDHQQLRHDLALQSAIDRDRPLASPAMAPVVGRTLAGSLPRLNTAVAAAILDIW